MADFKQKAKLGIIVAVIAIGVIFSVDFLFNYAQLETYNGPPKALIIDQLYDEMPNNIFHTKATQFLETAGYTVDIVTTQNVTVDFYKELPKMNYKYVVVRTHGAEKTNDVVLFTGEKYSEEKYIHEQLLGQVKKAAPLLERAFHVSNDDGSEWIIVNETTRYKVTRANPITESSNEYFAISSDLVRHGMKGKFDDTIFLLGGCNTLSNPSLAKSLTDRGASLVVGWDDTVSNSDNDSALLFFLEKSLVEKTEYEQVLKDLLEYKNPEKMSYPSTLIYYN